MDGLKSFDGTLEEAVNRVQAMDNKLNKELEKIKF